MIFTNFDIEFTVKNKNVVSRIFEIFRYFNMGFLNAGNPWFARNHSSLVTMGDHGYIGINNSVEKVSKFCFVWGKRFPEKTYLQTLVKKGGFTLVAASE